MTVRVSNRSLVATGLVVALCITAAAAGAVAVTMRSSKNSALGADIVVSATGRTLYHYGKENKNAVRCTGSCATTWPPLLIAAGKKPVAGAGLTAAKVGTVKRPDGKMQVTYGGYALYLFSGDSKAGDVNGQGLEGIWHAVAPTGAVVTTPASSGASSSTSSGYGAAPTTTTSSGGGYGY
jgi:predicted lipoprotein with Yx(FWY)xxD motif